MKTVSSTFVPVLPVEKGSGAPTLGDIKRSIPAELFERSLVHSMAHLASDLIQIGLGLAFFVYIVESMTHPLLYALFYALFIAWQGPTMTGAWVIAHECGHGGFSDSTLVNDVVGYILHTMLYVPYAAWQASHSKHHHYTNSVTMDEPFVPPRVRDEDVIELEASGAKVKAVDSAPTPSFFKTVMNVLIMETIGWPLYLAVNASGPASDGLVSHYDPKVPFMKKNTGWKIVLGNVGLVVWTGFLAYVASQVGFWYLVRAYGLPLAVTNMFLVTITFLQHTDPEVPHYDAETWTWLRGAVATVDRTMGPYLDYKTHHIADSHVVHHIFSSMPFYNAVKATPYVKAALGEYYVARGNGFGDFLSALWLSAGTCEVVHGKGVLHFVIDQDHHH